MTQNSKQDLIAQLFEDALTGKGARRLSASSVEALFEFAASRPYRLQFVEANLIEPQFDRPAFEYSISGPLPLTGRGMEADKQEAIGLFRELNARAQTERYAVRYDVWFEEL